MRKLIVSMNITLNGCMAGPNGELDWHYNLWSEDMARATALQLSRADTLLLGRKTYEAMAGYWIAKARNSFGPRDDIDFTDMINGCTKIVFSKKLRTTQWYNSRLAQKSIKAEITALKKHTGKDILVYGSGKLVEALDKHHLIDEYHLWVHPVVVEDGRPLFADTPEMRLLNKTEFDTGVVLMAYKAVVQTDQTYVKSCV